MNCDTKRRSIRLLPGTIGLIALMMSPVAMASGVKHHHGHGQAHLLRASCRHCHFQAAYGGHEARSLNSRHMMVQRVHVRMASWGPEPSYGEREAQRRDEVERARYAALAERRGRLLASYEREAPITAKLNLDQLRLGRERDAEIAQWASQYGTAKGG